MTTTAPPRRPGSRRGGGASGGRSPGAGAASAEALKGASLESPSRPSLRLVRPPRRFRPRLLGSLAVTIGFITLFLVAAMQAVLVQGQLKLDKLDGEVSARETVRNRLQAQIDQLESPDRLAQQAGAIGMVTPPEVVFLYASPPAASASAASAYRRYPHHPHHPGSRRGLTHGGHFGHRQVGSSGGRRDGPRMTAWRTPTGPVRRPHVDRVRPGGPLVPVRRPKTVGPIRTRTGGGRGHGTRGRRPTVTRGHHRRLLAVLLVAMLLFCALVVKLAQLQAVSPAKYTGYARDQRVHAEALPATRGAILDRNGLPLATTVTKHAVWSDSALVTNGAVAAKKLADVLGGEPRFYQDKLLYGGRFSYLARAVNDDVAQKVADAKLDGVFLLDEATRATPADGLALSVLGMTDPDNVGTAGLEKLFNDVLGGEPGRLVQEESREGHTIPSGEHRVIPARPGSNLQLTIDRNLQFTVEQALSAQVASVKAKRGVAVVMEPHSGEVMAMASVETNGQGADQKVVNSAQNLAVTAQFEPGSVMKPITMAAGIEQLGMSPTSVRTVPTSVEVEGTTFYSENRTKPADLSMTDILAKSDNVGTINIAQDVGPDGLASYLRRFHFGVRTGISLPSEESGSLPALEDWSGTSLPTLSMGQGVAVTPLQLATAYSAIANGGEWVAPSVVRATTDPSGREHPLSPGLRSQVIEPATAADLRTMLAAVVQRGTGKAAAIPGYDVAGKTGTAWKAQAGGYGYAGERAYVASFAGMVPVSDPKLVIVVMIDEPQGNTYSGGDAAAPAFAGIALPTLVALSIPPANWNAQATAGRAADQKVRAAAAVAPTTTTTAPPPTTAPAPTPASSTPGASTQTATALPSTAAPATAGVGGHG